MPYVYSLFSFVFTPVTRLWAGRQNEVDEGRLGFPLFISSPVRPHQVSPSAVGVKDFRIFTAEPTEWLDK